MSNGIRKRRKALGLSQEALARLADCSTAYVRYLDGGTVPGNDAPAYERVLSALSEQEKAATR